MDSEKVKIIKEILENCADEKKPCSDCKYFGKCEKLLGKREVLTLINDLESENEWLVGKVKEKVNEMTTYTVNNQKLKNRIAELEKEKDEQLKQFAERLKKKMGVREYMGVKYKQGVFSENDIDEILKEFNDGKV